MEGPAHFISYGLRKMGLPKSDPSIYNQGIKGISAWFFCYRLSGPSGYPVAVTLNKYVKGIYRIQLGIDLHFLQTGYHERILDRIINDQGEIHFVIGNCLISMCGYIHCQRFVLLIATVY